MTHSHRLLAAVATAAASLGAASPALAAGTSSSIIHPLASSPYSAGDGSAPVALTFTPDGSGLITADLGLGAASSFQVGQDGALTMAAGPFTTADPGASDVATSDGDLVAVATTSGVTLFTRAVDGTLTLPAPPPPPRGSRRWASR